MLGGATTPNGATGASAAERGAACWQNFKKSGMWSHWSYSYVEDTVSKEG